MQWLGILLNSGYAPGCITDIDTAFVSSDKKRLSTARLAYTFIVPFDEVGKIHPVWLGPASTSTHLLGRANVRVSLLDADRPAHVTAFVTTLQPQYTNKAAPDKWLRAPWAHHASQSRYKVVRSLYLANTLTY